MCSVCDRPYHNFCLTPAIKNLPSVWKCDHCFKCKSCGTNSFFSEEDVANGVNTSTDIDSEYALSKNFNLCYQCGQNESKKQTCSICLDKTPVDLNKRLETLKCRDCGTYSHISCSRVNVPELQSLFQEYVEALKQHGKDDEADNLLQMTQLAQLQYVYKCLDCVIAGKSVNFLILESCQHYENIHCLIRR